MCELHFLPILFFCTEKSCFKFSCSKCVNTHQIDFHLKNKTYQNLELISEIEKNYQNSRDFFFNSIEKAYNYIEPKHFDLFSMKSNDNFSMVFLVALNKLNKIIDKFFYEKQQEYLYFSLIFLKNLQFFLDFYEKNLNFERFTNNFKKKKFVEIFPQFFKLFNENNKIQITFNSEKLKNIEIILQNLIKIKPKSPKNPLIFLEKNFKVFDPVSEDIFYQFGLAKNQEKFFCVNSSYNFLSEKEIEFFLKIASIRIFRNKLKNLKYKFTTFLKDSNSEVKLIPCGELKQILTKNPKIYVVELELFGNNKREIVCFLADGLNPIFGENFTSFFINFYKKNIKIEISNCFKKIIEETCESLNIIYKDGLEKIKKFDEFFIQFNLESSKILIENLEEKCSIILNLKEDLKKPEKECLDFLMNLVFIEKNFNWKNYSFFLNKNYVFVKFDKKDNNNNVLWAFRMFDNINLVKEIFIEWKNNKVNFEIFDKKDDKNIKIKNLLNIFFFMKILMILKLN